MVRRRVDRPAVWTTCLNLHRPWGQVRTADQSRVIRGRKENPSLSNAALRNLGIAALGLGGLGIALFWLQFGGPIVAFIGFAAGLTALFVGASRGDAPMGLGYAGAGLSFIGIVLGGYWTYSSITKPGESQIAAAKTHGGRGR